MLKLAAQHVNTPRRAAVLVVVVMVLALAEFIVRTPMHGVYKMWDFAVFYTSSRAWLAGENPYARGAMADVWQQAGGNTSIMDGLVEDDFANASPNLPNPKPWLATQFIPAALPVVAPFAMLPADDAQLAWAALVYGLVIAQVFAVAHLMRWPWISCRTGLLAAAMLVLEPLHQGVAVGQPSTPTISLILIALALARDGNSGAIARVLAGLLLACGAALKPQLAMPFIVYLGWRRDWVTTGAAIGFFATLWLGATLPMNAAAIDWAGEWKRNLVWAQTHGIDSSDRSAPFRHAMLNLQVLLHAFTDNRTLVNAASLAVVAALALITVGLRSRIPPNAPQREQTALSAVAVLTLLPVYHRFYDATLLLLPIGWAIDSIARGKSHAPGGAAVSRIAMALFVLCMITFAAPYNWIEKLFGLPIDSPVRSSWWWTLILVPHRCVIVMTMACTLLVALNRIRVRAARGMIADGAATPEDGTRSAPFSQAA